MFFFFFSSRRRHTRCGRDWSSDVCSSDLVIRCLESNPKASCVAAACKNLSNGDEEQYYRIAFTSVRLPRASMSTRVSVSGEELFSCTVRLENLECWARMVSFELSRSATSPFPTPTESGRFPWRKHSTLG